MPKVIAVFCLAVMMIVLNFAQPAVAFDSNLKGQVESLAEKIMLLQSQGVEMDSLRKNPDRLAQCGNLMRSRQPIARALVDEVGAIPSGDFATGYIKETLGGAANSLNLCVSCYRLAMDSCASSRQSLNFVQDWLDDN